MTALANCPRCDRILMGSARTCVVHGDQIDVGGRAPALETVQDRAGGRQARLEDDIPAPASAPASFAALGVAADLIAVLRGTGITEPTPVQVRAIPDMLAGRDVCGQAQTGSGKTLAFGLPLIERTETARARRPHSLVIVPTRELANQIAEALAPFAAARGLWLTAIYGGVSMLRQIQALRAGIDIVIATPGRLNDLLEREELSLEDVHLVVLDEADQMADMGFLPQVDRILRRIDAATTQVALFSATLDGDAGKLVRKYQHDPVRHTVTAAEAPIEMLEHRFIGVSADAKIAVAAQVCAGANRALVFVRTAHGADRVAKQLALHGLAAAALHGRMAQGKRERTLAEFAGGGTPVLVATNVAARGLHVDGVDVVIHFDPPEDPKTFLHRSGRTARAGEAGLSVTLVLSEQARDVTRLQHDAGLNLEIVTMDEHDPRLLDLTKWTPPRARSIALPTYEVSGRRPVVNRKPVARVAPRTAVRAR